MTQRRYTFSDSLVLNQEFTNWEAFASTEHAQKQKQKQSRRKRAQDENWNANKFHGSPRPRAPSVFEEFSWRLFDQHDNIFNDDNILDWDDFTETETQVNTTPMSSAMSYLTPATTYSKEAEPVLFDFDSDFFDFDFDSDFEPCSPCLEEATVAPTPPRETATVAPTPPCETATVAPTPPRETAKCVPLIQQPTQPKKRKAETPQSKSRKRPYKNVREKRRRASIKGKLTELHAVCISDAVTSIVPRPRAKELIIPFEGSDVDKAGTQKPCKMDILRDSIRILEAMDKELIKLRARNKELRMRNLK